MYLSMFLCTVSMYGVVEKNSKLSQPRDFRVKQNGRKSENDNSWPSFFPPFSMYSGPPVLLAARIDRRFFWHRGYEGPFLALVFPPFSIYSCIVEVVGLPGSGVACAFNRFTVEIVKFREKSVHRRGTPGEFFSGQVKKGYK